MRFNEPHRETSLKASISNLGMRQNILKGLSLNVETTIKNLLGTTIVPRFMDPQCAYQPSGFVQTFQY